jgi:hypothetical protein
MDRTKTDGGAPASRIGHRITARATHQSPGPRAEPIALGDDPTIGRPKGLGRVRDPRRESPQNTAQSLRNAGNPGKNSK